MRLVVVVVGVGRQEYSCLKEEARCVFLCV